MNRSQDPYRAERVEAERQIAALREEVDRLQRRNRQMEDQSRAFLMAIEHVANTLSNEPDLRAALRRIALVAVRLTGAVKSVAYLAESSGGLTVEAIETSQAAESGLLRPITPTGTLASTAPEQQAEDDHNQTHIAPGQGIAGHVAMTGELILSPDAGSDGRIPAPALAVESQTLGMTPGSLLVLPVVYRGSVTGALEVVKDVGAPSFDVRSLDIMHTLAAEAAVAIANAQLSERIGAERDRIIQAQKGERSLIARDLHDGPMQRLADVVTTLSLAETLLQQDPEKAQQELQIARGYAERASQELRDILFDLRPRVLETEKGDLVAALRSFLTRFTARRSPQTPHIRFEATYPERLDPNTELTVFVIVREAVYNALKHAQAKTCVIELRESETALTATVRDDGKGFDMRQVMQEYPTRDRWGLLSMHDRATLIGGALSIWSQPGKGTLVTLEVPRTPGDAAR